MCIFTVGLLYLSIESVFSWLWWIRAAFLFYPLRNKYNGSICILRMQPHEHSSIEECIIFSMSKRKNLKWNCSWIQNLFLRFDGKRSSDSSVVPVLVARRNIFLITLLRISITCASKPKTAECILKLWREEVGMKYEVHMHTHTAFSICLIHSLQSWKK